MESKILKKGETLMKKEENLEYTTFIEKVKKGDYSEKNQGKIQELKINDLLNEVEPIYIYGIR